MLMFLFSFCKPNLELSNYNGIWQSIGHGVILEIKGGETYAFYDTTSISCVPRRTGSLDEITRALTLKSDTLSLTIGVITTRYTKASSLPILCRKPIETEKANDPRYNFDVFMKTVKDNYAFLQLNKIHWDELYQNQKAKLGPTSNHADLFLLIEETFEKLNDNHAYLDASDEVYDLVDKLYPEEEESKDTLPALGDFHVAHTVAKHEGRYDKRLLVDSLGKNRG